MKKIITIVFVSYLMSACSSIGPFFVKHTDSADAGLQVLREGTTSVELEEIKLPEPLPLEAPKVRIGETEQAPAKEQPEQVFDLHVDKAEASDFFRGLVADTDLNMVVHPEVKGQVSLSLKNVSVSDVMAVMRDVYGYDSSLRGNVYQVFPDVLRTEIFHLNYLNVARKGSSEMQVSAGKVSDAGGGSGSNSGSNQSTSYDDSGSSGGGSGQVVGTIVNTSADADLWSEVGQTLESLVAVDNGSQVVVTPQVGLVVVKAKPATLRAVSDYLALVEQTLTRQVVLEAKVVEVTLNEGFQAGIDWHTFGDSSGGSFDPRQFLDATGNLVNQPGSEHRVAGQFSGTPADLLNPLGGSFTLNTAFGDFDATINLLRTQGSVQVLSSPRIATVNNQKAVIKVGSDEFFVTDISSNTVTAGSAINTNDSPELTPFFSGIALDVTPQISSTGNVILHVHPTVSEVTEQLKQIGGELVPLAASTIRESDSIVQAQSGQIVVIGGLMQNSSKDNNAGVPWLSRIPVIGNLFKQKGQTGVKSELVILLKPVVVDAESQRQMLEESSARAQLLRDRMRTRG